MKFLYNVYTSKGLRLINDFLKYVSMFKKKNVLLLFWGNLRSVYSVLFET